MRNLMTLAAGAALALGGTAMAQDVQRTFAVAAFDHLEASGPHRVVVEVGGPTAVRATGTGEVLDKLEAVVERGKLRIRPRAAYRRNFSWRELPPATFYVTTPRLEGVALAGSGNVSIDNVTADDFDAAVAGSGNLDIAHLDSRDASFAIAGSGDLVVRGRARRSEISIAGSGDMRGSGLSSDAVSVDIAGSGDVATTARDRADVSIVGSGSAEIGGTARCSVSRIGSGRVRCGA